jgi:molybdenum cofactor cytidylyltransferase
MRSPSFAGLILAAGYSTRMGRDKALLPWHHGTFLSAAIESLAPFTDFVVVVAGENADNLKRIVYAHGASLIVNPEPQRGQFSSLRIGLSEVLNHGRDAAIITLVDRPAAERPTVAQLRETFVHELNSPERTHANNLWALVPEFEGKHGHPYIAGREMIEAFLRAPITSNAREVEHAHQAHITYLPVKDPLVIANVDTPEQYDALIH